MRVRSFPVMLLSLVLAGSLPTQVLAQMTQIKPPGGANIGNPYNQYLQLPAVIPPILNDTGSTMPTVSGNVQRQLPNRNRDVERSLTEDLSNQGQILQIDPALLPSLPAGAHHSAEGRRLQEESQRLQESNNLLPQGSQVQEFDPRQREEQRQGARSQERQRQSQPEDFGLMEHLGALRNRPSNSQRERTREQWQPGLPRQDSLVRDGGGGGSGSRPAPVGFAQRERTETRTTYESTGQYAGYTVTVEHHPGSRVYIMTVTTPTGEMYRIESTRRSDGRYEHNVYHTDRNGHTERIGSSGSTREPAGLREAAYVIHIDRGEMSLPPRARTRDCAPDMPCGGNTSPQPWEVSPVFEHLRPQTPRDRLMESERPGAQVRPAEPESGTAPPRLVIDPDNLLVNPGFEPRPQGQPHDPSRFNPPNQVDPPRDPNR
ncbi:hypothetical protein [Thermosynechococcus sp. FA-CM-4201]